MIVLNWLVPDKDIEIKFTGLKPGEKMYEELFRDGDMAGMLTKIKELIPAYTGWPRKGKSGVGGGE